MAERRTVAYYVAGTALGFIAVLAAESAFHFDDADEAASISDTGLAAPRAADAPGTGSTNPAGAALEQAIAIEDHTLREFTIRRIARAWARSDAQTAMAFADRLPQRRLAHLVQLDVLAEWILVDHKAALEQFVNFANAKASDLLSSASITTVSALVDLLALQDPDAALAAADRIPGALADRLRYAVERQRIARDPEAAMARLETLSGLERRSLLSEIADSYARRSRQEALEWARGLDPASREMALGQIFYVVAESNPSEAIALALAEPDAASRVGALVGGRMAMIPVGEIAGIADMLRAAGPGQQQSVATLLEAWPARDPDGALEWLLRQDLTADPSLAQSMAEGFGGSGVAIPAQSIFSLPAAARSGWVTSYVSEFAKLEPGAAVDWLQSFRYEPDYASLAAGVADQLVNARVAGPSSRLYPRPAAAILETLQQPPLETVRATAVFWTLEEPAEAARWSLGLNNPATRTVAVAQTVGAWTVDEPEAAVQFALGLPRGSMRDAALAAQLAQGIATHGSVDRRVLDAFSSNDARGDALRIRSLSLAFRSFGSREPDAAKLLLERLIDDPALRETIVGDIDRIRQRGNEIHRNAVLDYNP